MSENSGKVSAAASRAEDCIHPVQSSSVLPCRILPHRGAALSGFTRCRQSGFIKAPHCCPSSLRCMWTHIIGQLRQLRRAGKKPEHNQEMRGRHTGGFVLCKPWRLGHFVQCVGSLCINFKCFILPATSSSVYLAGDTVIVVWHVTSWSYQLALYGWQVIP